jgi:hypothetical protein
MVRFYRSGSIAPGKFNGAMAFAKEIVKHVKTMTGVDVQIGIPIGGNPSRIGWSAQYQTLAAYDEMSTKLLGDAKYQDLVAKGGENFVPDTMRDELWRVL